MGDYRRSQPSIYIGEFEGVRHLLVARISLVLLVAAGRIALNVEK